MKIVVEPGKYVVAVSGGVDSVALLDMLQKLPKLDLIVAHFDHGIRSDSAEDRKLADELAEFYNLPFEFAKGQLGPMASEAIARQARYKFLRQVLKLHQADAIITAHHQDDVLETAIINMIRGTGRKGLSALGESNDIKRPLLKVPKTEIIKYAKQHKLRWREDFTNKDEKYLRNYVRHKLLTQFSKSDRSRLLKAIENLRQTNQQIDTLLIKQIGTQRALNRAWFSQLPHDMAMETVATWLRQNQVRSFDKKTLERLVVAAKTGRSGSQVDVTAKTKMAISQDKLLLK